MEEKSDFKDTYGHVMQDPEFARLCREKASEPTVTSDAILHALVDPYPRTRCGGQRQWQARRDLCVDEVAAERPPPRQAGLLVAQAPPEVNE